MPYKIEDTNGNIISLTLAASGGSVSAITDTLGRVVTFNWSSSGLQSITVKDSNGATRTIAFTYSLFTENATS